MARLLHCVLAVGAFAASACGGRFETASGDTDAGAGGGIETGGASSGGTSSGGTSSGGAGGMPATGGRPSSGGSGGVVGTGGSGGTVCGPCPGAACANALSLEVIPNGGNIADLSVQGSGITFDCYPNAGTACRWNCTSREYQLPDGTHTVTIQAPGYEPVTKSIEVENPTNCGCCGCCPFSTHLSVELQSSAAPPAACCADTQTDPANCGACGRRCPAGEACVDGRCPTARTCAEIEEDLTTFVESNRGCQIDEECLAVQVGCAPVRDLCEGSVFLSKNHDAGALASLLDEWSQCGSPTGCALCDLPTPPALCLGDRCGY